MPEGNKYGESCRIKKYKTQFKIVKISIPQLGKNEVLVRVRRSGLCASDLHLQDGQTPTVKLPFILGHELAGEVEKVGGEVADLADGDHVIPAIDITCEKCRFCISGRGNLCTCLKRIGLERDGVHEEYAVVPAFVGGETVPKIVPVLTEKRPK